MLSPLVHLFEKIGALRDGRTAGAGGQEPTAPCWPAPVRKPEAVDPKLVLPRRHSRTNPPLNVVAAAAPAAGPDHFVLSRTDSTR